MYVVIHHDEDTLSYYIYSEITCAPLIKFCSFNLRRSTCEGFNCSIMETDWHMTWIWCVSQLSVTVTGNTLALYQCQLLVLSYRNYRMFFI